MNTEFRKILKAGILICALAFLMLNSKSQFLNSAYAQEISTGIYPPVLQIEADPPASINSAISIENKSDQTINYNIILTPFHASKENNGQPEFDSALSTLYSDFFKKVQILDNNRVVKQVKLAPKQKKSLSMHIGILKGEKPADYYFTVVFVSEPLNSSNENSFVGARGGVGTNVLLSIGPKTEAQGSVEEFSAPGFVTKGPISFKLNIKNTGQSYFAPRGNIVIKNMFGQVVGSIETVPVNILSDSTRLIPSKGSNPAVPRVVWKEKFLLGPYNAELTMALSDKGPIIKQKTGFFAFPLEGLLGIGVAIIIVLGIIKRVRSKVNE